MFFSISWKILIARTMHSNSHSAFVLGTIFLIFFAQYSAYGLASAFFPRSPAGAAIGETLGARCRASECPPAACVVDGTYARLPNPQWA